MDVIPNTLVSPTSVYKVTSVQRGFDDTYILNCTQLRTSSPVVVRYVLDSGSLDLSQVKATFQLLSLLRHPVLPPFIEAFDDSGAACLAYDRFSGCKLTDFRSREASFHEDKARQFFAPLIDAIDYLHDQGVAHRNLAPSNILVDDELRIRVIGWGDATERLKRDPYTKPWPTPYDPPELFAGELVVGGFADSWALGGILHFLVTGRDPDPGHVSRSPGMSPSCYSLILKFMDQDPIRRFSPRQAKQHSWLITEPAGRVTGQRRTPIRGIMRSQSLGQGVNRGIPRTRSIPISLI
jgi:serine/threonine protein kinase